MYVYPLSLSYLRNWHGVPRHSSVVAISFLLKLEWLIRRVMWIRALTDAFQGFARLNRTTKVRSVSSRLLSSPETGRTEAFSSILPRNNSFREVHATHVTYSIHSYDGVLAERVNRLSRVAFFNETSRSRFGTGIMYICESVSHALGYRLTR